MADIKTRDVIKGTIKTLDRAEIYTHRMKEAAVKTRTAEIYGDHQENENDPGEERGYGNAAAVSAYTVRAGAELVTRSAEKARANRAKDANQTAREILGDIADDPDIPVHTVDMTAEEGYVQKAGREHAVKSITERKKRSAKTEYSVYLSKENAGVLNHGRAREPKTSPAKTGLGHRNRSKSEPEISEASALMQRRGKENAIRRITNKEPGSILPGWIGGKARRTGQRVKRGRNGRALNHILDSSGNLLKMLCAGGTAAVVIVLIMVIFGAALNMTEDGSYLIGTGDTAIVEVARGELGNEGDRQYSQWFGFEHHVHWCACFVSWCADQCGYIDAGTFPKFAAVANGADWYKSRHRWAGRGYKPNPGDIIFFDFERDGLLDHVGIVESCDGKTVSTIEGNSDDLCRRRSYTVGSAQIAGYGLTMRPAGNRGRLIALKATELAYPNAPREARYHGGKPTAAYKAALNRAYPHRSGWNAASKVGASCDVFVGVCLVDSGVDKNFPRGYEDQAERLDKKKDLYECVISTKTRNIKESELKDGDIIRYRRNNGGAHIFIYTGGKIKHAGIAKWYPRTTSPDSRLKISGKKQIWVYRVKD